MRARRGTVADYRIYPLKTGTIIVDKGASITRGIDLGLDVESYPRA